MHDGHTVLVKTQWAWKIYQRSLTDYRYTRARVCRCQFCFRVRLCLTTLYDYIEMVGIWDRRNPPMTLLWALLPLNGLHNLLAESYGVFKLALRRKVDLSSIENGFLFIFFWLKLYFRKFNIDYFVNVFLQKQGDEKLSNVCLKSNML